ncbi:hypothetical protein BE11_12315 [Sorangium cellulosum]|nr:hypothetical protein BE11_12315 [Sorangium cellulosum]
MTVVGEYPPGSRVKVRGEEWMVERSLAIPQGGVAIHVQGLSDLVRHHKAVFLSELDTIDVLNPEQTQLVTDDSPGYRRTRLFLETLLRRTPPTDARVHVGHRGALDVMAYQLFPAQKALSSLRPRLLIADGTGLGKTVEVGLLLSELIKRGRARRILVVAIKSMLAQLQRELWARFTIPLVRLDSDGLARVQQKIPSNRNPFSHFDRCILSVDTLKNNARYRAWLEEIPWDVIVVDECHNVSNRGSQREQLARLLAARCDALVLTSATPHNGKPESFANLMRMLDPTAVADDRQFVEADVRHLYVRRFKKDVEGQAGTSLQDRAIHLHQADASAAEEAALAALHALTLHNLGRKRHGVDHLLRWALVKAFLSSPDAALETLDERIKNTEGALAGGAAGPHPYAAVLRADLEALRAVRTKVAAACTEAAFSKLGRLLAELRAVGFTGKPDSPRVVIFSERISTLKRLQSALPRAFGIADPDQVVGRYDASSQRTETELRNLQESFGRESSPMRLLLASDAASEGVNLHYHCAQLFHFDMPWSLIRLTQRNGRIDRFGQKHTPHLHYLMTRTRKTTADQHVMRRLVEKEQTATRQLGDVGAQLGLYDPETEERYLTEGVAAGRDVNELLPDAPLAVGRAEAQIAVADEADDDEADDRGATTAVREPAPAEPGTGPVDLLALVAEIERREAGIEADPDAVGSTAAPAAAPTGSLAVPGAPRPGGTAAEEPERPAIDLVALLAAHEAAEAKAPPIEQLVAADPTLFADDYGFLVAALRHLEKHPAVGETPLSWEANDAHRTLKIAAPEPFRAYREPFLPAEALPDNGTYQLVQSRDEVARRLRSALEGDGSWPEWHLLWEQHPLVEWLLDALAASYARLEAPVLRAPAVPKGSAFFLLSALLYNTESQPVYAGWFALESRGANLGAAPIPFAELAGRVGLAGDLVNPGKPSARIAALQALVEPVIRRAREVVAEQRKDAMKGLLKKLRAEERRVTEWHARSLAALAERRERYEARQERVPVLLERKLRDEERSIERARRNHREWIERLQAAGAPYVRLVAVFSGE